MKENFDYVTMANYKADMSEATERAVTALNAVRYRAEQAERELQETKALVAEIVKAAGGTVTIPERLGWRPTELTTWRDNADRTIIFETVSANEQ